MKLFVNGEQVAQNTAAHEPTLMTRAHHYLGRQVDTDGYYWGILFICFWIHRFLRELKTKTQVQKPGAPVTKQRVQKQKPNCAQKPARALARGRAAVRLHARAQWCRASDCAPGLRARRTRMQAVGGRDVHQAQHPVGGRGRGRENEKGGWAPREGGRGVRVPADF